MSANLYAILAKHWPEDPDAPCFCSPGAPPVTYGAVREGSARMAALLKARGVTTGDRVAVQAPKSVETVLVYLACLRLGAVYMPLNTAYTDSEIGYFLDDAEPAVFLTDTVTAMAQARTCDPWAPIHPAQADDLAALIYTSGTTGRSKGAMLSHGNLAANALALHEAWGFTREDVLLHALPIFHVHGLFIALHCILLSGGPTIWLDRFETGAVIDAMDRATVMMGVPTFYTRLLDDPRFTAERAKSMRLFISGSAPLLETTFADFETRTGHRILERYGMSEAIIITSNPLDGDRLPGTVGFPLPQVSLRVPEPQPGVIEIKGPSVFAGYWRMPEKTAEDFTADGYFITGDLGLQDAEGRVSIVGRQKDLIISGGYNVYPKEIELVLDGVEGVTESAVIGVPHRDFGEAVVAVIDGTGDEAAILAAAREQLAGFKVPKRIVFVEALPRNAMGKVQKAQLRETYADILDERTG